MGMWTTSHGELPTMSVRLLSVSTDARDARQDPQTWSRIKTINNKKFKKALFHYQHLLCSQLWYLNWINKWGLVLRMKISEILLLVQMNIMVSLYWFWKTQLHPGKVGGCHTLTSRRQLQYTSTLVIPYSFYPYQLHGSLHSLQIRNTHHKHKA